MGLGVRNSPKLKTARSVLDAETAKDAASY